jgi:hypothetical protein
MAAGRGGLVATARNDLVNFGFQDPWKILPCFFPRLGNRDRAQGRMSYFFSATGSSKPSRHGNWPYFLTARWPPTGTGRYAARHPQPAPHHPRGQSRPIRGSIYFRHSCCFLACIVWPDWEGRCLTAPSKAVVHFRQLAVDAKTSSALLLRRLENRRSQLIGQYSTKPLSWIARINFGFQSLEKLVAAISSKPWKNSCGFFQGLEKVAVKFSNAWENRWLDFPILGKQR